MNLLFNYPLERFFVPVLVYFCCPTLLWGQSLPGDSCTTAIWLAPNQTLQPQSNQTATLNPTSLPANQPITCIKTFENDLWYQYTTNSAFTYYQVQITPLGCETPAGLQAMIILADDCQPSTYQYVACTNPNREIPLDLTWQDTLPGRHYFVYVDGFDGNVCEFTLTFRAFAQPPTAFKPAPSPQFDYEMSDSSFIPDDLQVRSLNNEMVVSWQTSTDEEVRDFQVQLLVPSKPPFASTIGRVPPQALAGSESLVEYRYAHLGTFTPDQTYCYRLVKIFNNGARQYSAFQCATSQVVEDFYISPVFPHDQPGTYKIQFINRVKQDLHFTVLDGTGAELKSLTRAKEKKGDGIITIDMRPYPAGTYQLRVDGKAAYFLRTFVVD